MRVTKKNYSNVIVYECFVSGVVILRRVADGWMNATQLIKLSGLKPELEAAFIDREIAQYDCQLIQHQDPMLRGVW